MNVTTTISENTRLRTHTHCRDALSVYANYCCTALIALSVEVCTPSLGNDDLNKTLIFTDVPEVKKRGNI